MSRTEDPRPSDAPASQLPELPKPSPELRARFDATDRPLEGLTGEEKLRAARELYYDADGMPQLRRARIRAVPSPDC